MLANKIIFTHKHNYDIYIYIYDMYIILYNIYVRTVNVTINTTSFETSAPALIVFTNQHFNMFQQNHQHIWLQTNCANHREYCDKLVSKASEFQSLDQNIFKLWILFQTISMTRINSMLPCVVASKYKEITWYYIYIYVQCNHIQWYMMYKVYTGLYIYITNIYKCPQMT